MITNKERFFNRKHSTYCRLAMILVIFLFLIPLETQAQSNKLDISKVKKTDLVTPELKFYIACTTGRRNILEEALMEYADLNTIFITKNPVLEDTTFEITGLSLAVINGHKIIVSDLYFFSKRTPLYQAEDLDVDIKDATGNTALLWAVKLFNKEIVEILLKFHPDTKIKDINQMTALDYAKTYENKEIAEMIRDYEKKIEELNTQNLFEKLIKNPD